MGSSRLLLPEAGYTPSGLATLRFSVRPVTGSSISWYDTGRRGLPGVSFFGTSQLTVLGDGVDHAELVRGRGEVVAARVAEGHDLGLDDVAEAEALAHAHLVALRQAGVSYHKAVNSSQNVRDAHDARDLLSRLGDRAVVDDLDGNVRLCWGEAGDLVSAGQNDAKLRGREEGEVDRERSNSPGQ
jgi:hypothetical protein